MSDFLYITADVVGQKSGGGVVTYHESEALKTLGSCEVWGREQLQDTKGPEPWLWDVIAAEEYVRRWYDGFRPKLAHLYAGTFGNLVRCLKHRDCLVTYTCAAHDVSVSRCEHEKLGLDFAKMYPHLVEPDLWRKYARGYFLADVLIAPSTYSKRTLEQQAVDLGVHCPRIEVIPHGCDLPDKIAPLPEKFTVGYLGSYGGADKGFIYLLQAWKKLDYTNATLILGGKDSASPWVKQLVQQVGCKNIIHLGWLENVNNFYNDLSLYVQPSTTEGFGIEIIEAMSCGRLALCSTGAGAVDLALDSFSACDSNALAEKIDYYKQNQDLLVQLGEQALVVSSNYTWNKVRERYVALWRSLL